MTRPLLLLAAALAGAALAHRRDLRERDGELHAALKGGQELRHDLALAQKSEQKHREELERARTPLAGAGERGGQRGGFKTWAELGRGQA